MYLVIVLRIVAGLGVYFFYGMWHSNIRQKKSPSKPIDSAKDKDDVFSSIT